MRIVFQEQQKEVLGISENRKHTWEEEDEPDDSSRDLKP